MKKSLVIVGAGLVAIIAAGIWLWQDEEHTGTSDVETDVATTRNPDAAAGASAPNQPAASNPTQTPMLPSRPSDEPDELTEDPAKMFVADSAGNLVLKEHTRINVEKILWVYTPDEQKQKLAVIEQTLPAGAYRQLTDLMDRYQNFTLASKQTYPPDVAPASVEDAITQHEGLSALRKAHFGNEAADAMFGREEKLNRQLLEFMKLEKHEGMTMDEKAMKAQEMLSKSPELQAAYEKNRAASPNPN